MADLPAGVAQQVLAALDKDEQIASLVNQLGSQAAMYGRMVSQYEAAMAMNAKAISRLQEDLAEREARIVDLAGRLATFEEATIEEPLPVEAPITEQGFDQP